jgi:arsenate reductase
MKDDGVDISGHTSNNALEYQEIYFDFVITVCDNVEKDVPICQVGRRRFIITSLTRQKQLELMKK